MFDGFKDFLRGIGAMGEGGREAPDADDPRIAAAALLFHVAAADGAVAPEERRLLKARLAEEFALMAGEAARIAEAGLEADREAVDLYRFTHVLKTRLDAPRRVRFVELLWEVTFADGAVHELEDNTIWRIAELLGVSTRERMLMKARAAAATMPDGDGPDEDGPDEDGPNGNGPDGDSKPDG